MTFNKNKSMALAQKFVQKGQIDRAIKEYQRILETDRKDIRTKLKIGDLYAKKGDNQEAAKIYQEVAESYAKDGFFLKAVAVYKNILKLCPDLIEVNLKLGDLYHHLSLLGDAMSQYQIVVNYYDRQGMVKESLDTLKKMVELDPENITFKVNLAELYLKEGHAQQALSEFESLAKDLKASGKNEELLKVYEKILHHDPEREEIVKELARLYLEQNQAQKALAKLQISFKANPKNTDTLELLAKAFLQLNQPKKAKSVFRELAQVYADSGDAEGKSKACQQALKISPNDPEIMSLLHGEEIGGGPVHGAPDPAAPAPTEVTQYDNEVTEFTLHTVTSPLDPMAPADEVMSIAPEPPIGEAEPAIDLSAQSEVEPLAAPEPSIHLQPEGAETDDFGDLDEEIAKLITETDVYLKYGLHDKAKEHLQAIIAKRPSHFDARVRLKDLLVQSGEKGAAIEELKRLVGFAQQAPAESEARKQLATLQAELTKLAPAQGAAAPEPSADEVEIQFDLSEEVEQVPVAESSVIALEPMEADASQGVTPSPEITQVEGTADSATLDLDLGIEIEVPTEEVPEITPPPIAEPIPEPVMETTPPVSQTPVPQFPVAALSEQGEGKGDKLPVEIREELDEAEFFIQQGLADEARKIYDDLVGRFAGNPAIEAEIRMKMVTSFPDQGESRVIIQPKSAGIPAPIPPAVPPETIPVEEEATFDLAAELSQELDTFQESPAGAPAEKQVDFKEVFDEFKKGVAKQLGKEDSETHFDLGLAYKEMHLLDDAINEFQIAMADPQKVVEGYTMIGLCFMDKGEFDKAEEYFQQGLGWKSIRKHEVVGLNYELGMAQMAGGKYQEALRSFEKVHEADEHFRDIGEKIEEVRQSLGGQTQPIQPRAAEVAEEGEGSFDLGASLAEEGAEITPFPVAKGEAKKPSSQLTPVDAFATPSETVTRRDSSSERTQQKSPSGTRYDEVAAVKSPVRSHKSEKKVKSKISYV